MTRVMGRLRKPAVTVDLVLRGRKGVRERASRDPMEMETESSPMEENDGIQDINGRDYSPQRPPGQNYMVL